MTLLLLTLFFCFRPAGTEAAAKNVSTWVKTEKGFRYYDKAGKPVKASKAQKYRTVTIKGKKYCFNDKGYQVYGWRRINNKYYYFSYRYSKRGYMLKDTVVNGVKLRKSSGSAVVSGTRVKQKLPLMCLYQEWTDEVLSSHPYGSRAEKLVVCFDYLRRLPYATVREFKNIPNRDIWDAEYVFKYRRFDCHRIANAFSYMALALGFRDVKVHDLSGAWHTMVQINGKYYDPSLARKDLKSYKLYRMDSYYTNSIWLTTDIDK